MRLQLFCHVFTAAWREPVGDLIDAFNSSRLAEASPDAYLGLMGPRVGREAVLDFWRQRCRMSAVVKVSAELGNEARTIEAVSAWARAHPEDATLYVHTKGAARPIELNRRWRRAMIEVLVLPWRDVLAQLGHVDVAGPFWLTNREGFSFFGGNFWMARNSYLARLSEVCPEEPRQAAEDWIGSSAPKVLNLLAGWPDFEYFGLERPRYGLPSLVVPEG